MTDFTFDVPCEPISNPGLWTRSELGPSENWIHRLSDDALAALDSALATVESHGLEPGELGPGDFPLGSFADEIAGYLDELESGRGFVLIRGVPVEKYTVAQLEKIFWGMGRHIGTPLSINADGHRLGHVIDLGYDANNTKVRNYQTTAELRFHNDMCDVIGLMCVHTAKSGGRSGLASVPAIHNTILQEDPDLLRALYQPMSVDRRGEPGRPDEGPELFYTLPVFSFDQGYLTSRLSTRSYYETALRFPGAAPMGDKERAALDLLEEVATRPELHIEFDMQPGDIQLVNNYCIYHRRSEFEDWPEPERKRHLLRLWLSVPNSRPLPPIYEKRFGSISPGTVRGGIPARERAAVPAPG